MNAATVGAWVSVLAVIAGGIFTLVKWMKAQQVDKVSAQSGIAAESRAGTGQVIDGLNALIDQLQEANKVFRDDGRLFREELAACGERIAAVVKERDEVMAERDRLRTEVYDLRAKYGIR